MVFKYLRLLFSILLIAFFALTTSAQVSKVHFQANPWKAGQLISPEDLANLIGAKEQVKIYNIGVVEDIKGAVNLGPASDQANLEKLQKIAESGNKNELIIIYCGCCPMDKCPNIRPAFKLLSASKFTNVRLLDLPVNLKVDWIDKGYPVK